MPRATMTDQWRGRLSAWRAREAAQARSIRAELIKQGAIVPARPASLPVLLTGSGVSRALAPSVPDICAAADNLAADYVDKSKQCIISLPVEDYSR